MPMKISPITETYWDPEKHYKPSKLWTVNYSTDSVFHYGSRQFKTKAKAVAFIKNKLQKLHDGKIVLAEVFKSWCFSEKDSNMRCVCKVGKPVASFKL